MIPLVSATLFVTAAVALHVLHARIAKDHPDLNTSAGRILLEITPSTELSRRLTRGKLSHRLAPAYRFSWYVHLLAGLVFAVSLIINAFVTLR